MKNWLMFGLLGFIWSSSFLLIKIGLDGGLDALSLVAIRLGLGAICFTVATFLMHKQLPRDRATIINLIIVGIINTALPFVLITWGENTIDSGLAGVLNSTVPLFSLVIAHLALADDKINLGKLLGLITGFAGIVLLASRSSMGANPLSGQLAVVAAAISYACAAVFIRRNLRNTDPLIVANGSLLFGAIAILGVTLLTVHPLPNLAALPLNAVFAVIGLGVVNTFIAYMMYFTLIANWGASRATMVTYLMPPLSLLLGAIFNQEQVDWRLIVGAVLIVGGVGLANFLKMPTKVAVTQ